MTGDARLKALSVNPGIDDPYVRLMFACFHKANVHGHAPFGQGEMKRVLGRDGGTEAHRNVVRSALNKLIKLGIAAEESTTRCVVLDSSLYRRGDNRRWLCHEETHTGRQDLKWVCGLGWEDSPGQWNGWLEDDEARDLIGGQLGLRPQSAPEIVHPRT